MPEKQPTTATTTTEPLLNPSFPPSRVKKIVKIDKDITRLTSEALYLISGATELFLQFLAEKSADIAAEKKRKTIKLDHLCLAVKRHQPTREFLLDSLPILLVDSQPLDCPQVDRAVKVKVMVKEKAVPAHTRRIDSFFKKPVSEKGLNRVDDDVVVLDRVEVVDDLMIDSVDDEGDVIADRSDDDVVDDVSLVENVDDLVQERVEDGVIPEHVEDVDDIVPERVEDDVIPEHVEYVDDVVPERVDKD